MRLGKPFGGRMSPYRLERGRDLTSLPHLNHNMAVIHAERWSIRSDPPFSLYRRFPEFGTLIGADYEVVLWSPHHLQFS